MKSGGSSALFERHVFGEFGGVNPSITDSSTYTFLASETMDRVFSGEIEGCYLYSRHWNPSNRNLSEALAAVECTESALVLSSGMAAISCTLLSLCGQGDEIITGRSIYGGTYALFKNVLPRYGIRVHFVDIQNSEEVRACLNSRTKVIYCESMSNPLLDIPEIPELSVIARRHGAKLVVDNTFCPLILSPARLGADIVIHSLTKFINGMSDCVAGAVCGSKELIASLMDVNSGTVMLLGPVLDGYRAAAILKNLHTLHIRVRKHSENATYLAKRFRELGLSVCYPGLPDHPHHERLLRLGDPEFGFGGMFTIDVGDRASADRLMAAFQKAGAGFLAVSLGYFRTLFNAPAHGTSSEIPESERRDMGLSDGVIRLSAGIEPDPEVLFQKMKRCLKETGILQKNAV